MTRLISLLMLASTPLAVLADNNIFGFSPSDPTCTACLDNVFLSCPGFYQDRSYAECMCGGDGSKNFVTCQSSSCDPGVNSPANAARMWFNYCTQFFPAELCPEAQPYMNSDIFQDQCSPEAIASGGLGSGSGGSSDDGSGTGSGSGSGSDSGSGSGSSTEESGSGSTPSSASGSGSGPTLSTPTNTATGGTGSPSKTGSGTDSTSKPTGSSSANIGMVPAWGVLGALGGAQLINLMV